MARKPKWETTIREAALRVLQDSKGKWLDDHVIHREIIDHGLARFDGKTPKASTNGALNKLARAGIIERDRGEGCFCYYGNGNPQRKLSDY